jgi:hypothetical protein
MRKKRRFWQSNHSRVVVTRTTNAVLLFCLVVLYSFRQQFNGGRNLHPQAIGDGGIPVNIYMQNVAMLDQSVRGSSEPEIIHIIHTR